MEQTTIGIDEDNIIIPGPFPTVGHVIKHHTEVYGGHFFDAQSRRFFHSRTAPGIHAGRFFITSEQDKPTGARGPAQCAWDGQRRYTVRIAHDDGTLSEVREVSIPGGCYWSGRDAFMFYGSLQAARNAVRRMLKGSGVTA